MLYQYMEQQLKMVQQQLQTVDQQIAELENVRHALHDLKQVPEGNEILVPIASGIFVKAKLNHHDDLIVNVGDNVSVVKTHEAAQALLERQNTELTTFRKKLLDALQHLSAQAKVVEAELEKVVKENEGSNV